VLGVSEGGVGMMEERLLVAAANDVVEASSAEYKRARELTRVASFVRGEARFLLYKSRLSRLSSPDEDEHVMLDP
jgi:hypothetical protein